jgi:intracellular multiplication protein IcmT
MESHWRNTIRVPRFFVFDARASLVFALLIIHPRIYTLYISIIAMFFFYLLERLGLTFDSALRKFRSWLCGAERPATVFTARRRLVDSSAADLIN